MHFIAALATFLGLIPRRFQPFKVSSEIEKAHPNHSVQFSENIYIWLENNQVLIACLQTFLGLTGEQGWSIWIGPRVKYLWMGLIALPRQSTSDNCLTFSFSPWGLNLGPYKLGKHSANGLHSSLAALNYSWMQTRWCSLLMKYFIPVHLILEKGL